MRQPASKPARKWKRVLAVFVSAAAALAVAEIAFRATGVAAAGVSMSFAGSENEASDTVPDRELFWRLRPRGGADPVTDLGMRGGSFSTTKGPRDLRVLCVGDSCTYGLGVRLFESWGMVLDRLVQARLEGGCVETVLAAAPGYSTYQDLALLRRHGTALSADVTILFVGVWNDMLPAASLRDSEFGAAVDRLEHHPFWSLRLGRLLWRTLHPLPTADDMKQRFRNAAKEAPRSTRVSLDEFRDNLRALVAFGRATGAVAAVLPSVRAVRSSVETPEYRRVQAEVYRELGVPCVDSDEAFRAFATLRTASGAREELCLDGAHPTALGHLAIAEALEPVVLGLVERQVRDARKAASRAAGPEIVTVEPRELAPGRAARIRLRGSGFSGAGLPKRILVNDQPVYVFRVEGDETVEADVDAELLCKPGPLSIAVRSSSGTRQAPPTASVLPWTPELTVTRDGNGSVVRASVDTTSSIAIEVWVSPELLPESIKTRWGPFRLANPAAPHPTLAFDQRLSIGQIALPHVSILRIYPGPSPVGGEARLPPEFARAGAPLYAQMMVRWGLIIESAWLSDVISVKPVDGGGR